MDLQDLILISVDDHIVEPPNMFEGRLARSHQDQAPRVLRADDGTDAWVFNGQSAPYLGLNAVAGRPRDEYGIEPTSYDEFRPGCYNVHERVKDMSANGVLASMNYPSFPRFCGQLFMNAASTDPALALAVVQAYNDWHIEEWAGAYPGRFIPCAIPPLWDAALMSQEVLRVAEKGCHAMTFSMNPYRLGLPSLHDPHWDQFWAACNETKTVVCMHIGSGSFEVTTSPDAPVDVRIACAGINMYPTAADLIYSPMVKEYKDLKFALAEGGIGWVPYFLERADYTYAHHSAWTGQDLGGLHPSEVFRNHIVTCFFDDAVGIENLHHLNAEMVTWECDYPHSDSTWPESPEKLAPQLAAIDDPTLIAKITHQNAMRIFSFDPFAAIPRQACTVGALRAAVAGHDVTLKSKGKRARVPATQAAMLEQSGNLVRSK